MSTPKKKKDAAPVAKSRGTTFSLRLGPDREAALARFIESQEVPPEKTAVILRALDKFLAEKGLLPPADR